VRYEVTAEAPLGARYCWCRVCQYLGCGTGAVGALFRKEDVTVSGPRRQRGDHAQALLYKMRHTDLQRGGRTADAHFIRAGRLDDPNLAAPTATIWTKSAPKWACFDPSLPGVEGHPPPLNV
jgi:hypothetical protein